jgi:hypothetical protein
MPIMPQAALNHRILVWRIRGRLLVVVQTRRSYLLPRAILNWPHKPGQQMSWQLLPELLFRLQEKA